MKRSKMNYKFIFFLIAVVASIPVWVFIFATALSAGGLNDPIDDPKITSDPEQEPFVRRMNQECKHKRIGESCDRPVVRRPAPMPPMTGGGND